MSKCIDLTGQNYGKLTARKRGPNNRWGTACWVCDCACGGQTTVSRNALRGGTTRSCGCLYRESVRDNRHARTHGLSKTGGIYCSWTCMKTRCDNQNVKYRHWGGRGIGYDPRWEKFDAFLADMRASWFPHAHLHRKDVDGDYSAANCVWLSAKDHRAEHKKTRTGAYARMAA